MLTELWNTQQREAIPRSVYFVNRGEEILIYALESGEMSVVFLYLALSRGLNSHTDPAGTPKLLL